jgi:hypothetical protein
MAISLLPFNLREIESLDDISLLLESSRWSGCGKGSLQAQDAWLRDSGQHFFNG